MKLAKLNFYTLFLLLAFVSNYSVAAPRGCMLVANTSTVIPPSYAGILSDYVKVTLNKKLFDTENACDATKSQITVPGWATWVKVTGHISFPAQNVGTGHYSIHLWRNVHNATNLTSYGTSYYSSVYASNAAGDGPTPEAHYHNRAYYPQQTGRNNDYYSILATTEWIPVLAVGETWTLYAWQDATYNGQDNPAVITPSNVENWLHVEFQ